MNNPTTRKAPVWYRRVGLCSLLLAGLLRAQEPNGSGSSEESSAFAPAATVVVRESTVDFTALALQQKFAPGTPVKKSKPAAPSLSTFRDQVSSAASTSQRAPKKIPPTKSKTISTATPLTSSAQTGAIAKALATVPSPAPSASFPALLGNTTINPDTHGAVGPNHLMVTLNTEVLIQDRSGGTISRVSLDSFWASTGASNVFDPRVIYEPYGQRWITTAECDPGGPNPGLLIGVSSDSNPTGTWYLRFIDLDASAPRYADSPNLGFNKDWIVLQANIFNGTNDFFIGSDIYVYNKANLYANGSAAPAKFSVPGHDSLMPATVYDTSVAEIYLLNVYSGSVEEVDIETGEKSNYGELGIWKITGTTSNPFLTNINDFVYSCPDCTWADYTPQPNFAPQLGGTNIYTGDSRIQSLIYRGGTYYAAHTVFVPTNNPGRAAVQWWQFLPEDAGGLIHVLSQERIEDATGGFFAFPSLAVNRNNQALIGYTRFSSTTYPSANYSYIGLDNFNRMDTVLKAGEAPFRRLTPNGLNLWGDWSATMVDPVNDTDFWTLQEYSARDGAVTNIWGTWWGRVSPPSELAIRMSEAPDPVLAGGNVTYTITVTNTEPIAQVIATGVRVENRLPPNTVFISGVTSQGGGCVLTNNIVTCDLGDVETTETATIILSPRSTGTLTNRVTLFANNLDGNTNDNSAVVTTLVNPAANLGVFFPDNLVSGNVSNNLAYLVVVTNLGPSAAASVSVTNALPPGATFVSAIPSVGTCSLSGTNVICTLGTVAAGAGPTIRVTVNPRLAGELTTTARIGSSTPDQFPANNTDSFAIRVNGRPTISAIGPRTIPEDTPIGPINFTVGDAETPAGELIVVAFSSNPTVVPVANIALGGTGASRNLIITPLPGAFGATTISLVATDADNASTTNSFVLTVAAVNDPPTVATLPNLTIPEDAGPQTVAFAGLTTGAANENQALTVTATSGNTSLVPHPTVSYVSPNSGGTIRFTPATNAFGSTVITVIVNDGGTSNNIATSTFTLTVSPANDAPTLNVINNVILNEDAGLQSVNLSGISAGPANEGQTASITATSSEPSVIPHPSVNYTNPASSGALRFAPMTNASGTATITVTVNDGGPSNNVVIRTFSVTVNAVNDLPTLDSIGNLSLAEDAAPQLVSLSGISSGADNENQTLTVAASSSNTGLIPHPTVNYSSPNDAGALTLAPTANASGTATISVTVNDGASSSNVVIRTFTVTVSPVNDTPTLNDITNVTMNEDAGPQAVALSGISSGAPNETQVLAVSATSSDPSVIPNPVVSYASANAAGTLTMTPATNAFGSATITVTVNDNGASNNLAVRTFLVTVNPVNDAPTLGSLGNLTINEDSGPRTVALAGISSGAANENQVLSVTATSSNPSLIANPTVSYASPSGTGSLQFTPSPDGAGTATITVMVDDGATANHIVTRTFTVTVNPSNDAPTLNPIPDLVIHEDSGPQSVSLGGISSGAANEAQMLTVTASTSHPSLVTNLAVNYGSPASSGVLTFRPVPNRSGTATLTVRVNDGASSNNIVSQSFSVSILPVNDLPSISAIPDQRTAEDTPRTNSFVVTDVETAATNLVLLAESSNEEVILSSGIQFGGVGTNRTVTVTPIPNAAGSATITITATDTDGASGTTSFEFTVHPVNDAPTLSTVPNQTMDEDGTIGPLAFTVGDADVDILPEELVVTASSSNPTLIPNSALSLGGAGEFRTLTIQPAPNQFGTSTITLAVSDEATTNARTFTVTVHPVNDVPSISALVDQTIAEDGVLAPVPFVIGDVETAASSLLVRSASSNPALVPLANIVIGGSGSNRTVAVTPVSNKGGNAIISIFVSDGSATNTNSFTLTVNEQNDLPSISALSHQTINENTATGPLAFSLADIETPTESLLLSLATSDPALLPTNNIILGGSGASRTVSVLPSPYLSGTGMVTITVRDADGGSSSSSFSVTVQSVNDAPTLDVVTGLTINEDSGLQTVSLTGISSGAPNENQTLTLTASTTTPGLITNLQVAYTSPDSNAVLTFGTVSNATGTAIITATLNDGGASNNVLSRTFHVNITGVNDLPSISAIEDQEVDEDNPTGFLSFSIGDAETALASLSLSSSSSNPSLVSSTSLVFGGTGVNRTVRVTPATNQFGIATVTLTVHDAQGGSASTSFKLTVAPKNDAPLISAISNQTIGEDGATAPLPFVVSDLETPAHNLVVTATSTNQALVPNDNIMFGGSGVNRTVAVAPNSGQTGTSLIIVTVRDADGVASSTSFLLTVGAVNDPPTIASIGDLVLNEDTSFMVPFVVDDLETVSGSLTVSATSSNTTLVPNANLALSGSGANRTVTITPAANQVGTTLVTLAVSDGVSSGTRSFLVTFNPVNDPPALNAIANVSMNEDSTQTVSLTGISAGPNESQILAITSSSSNPAVLPAPTVNYTSPAATGSLLLSSLPHASGTAVVTVMVNDGGSSNNITVRTFTVTVNAANDLPTISTIGNQTLGEDSSVTVGFIVGDVETPAMSLNVTAASSNPTLVPVTNIVISGSGSNRTATITPSANQTGNTTITLTVSDGTATAASSFNVTISAANDAPTLNPIPNVGVIAGNWTRAVPINGISSGAANEAQTLTVTAVSGNTSVVLVNNVSYTSPGATATINLQRASNGATGVSTVTVTVSDGVSTITRTFNVYVRSSGNNPPVISGVSDRSMAGDSVSPAFPFTVGDAGTAAGSLTVSGRSSNPTLVPDTGIVFGGSGSNRTVTITPASRQTGTAIIYLSVVDANSGYTGTNFSLTVTQANTLPIISSIPPQSIDEDTLLGPVLFNIGDSETSPASLVVSAVSTNQALVPNGNIILGGSGTNRALRLTPQANQTGTTLVTLTVTDGSGGSANTSFAVTVNPANDVPTITGIGNQSLAEDTSLPAVAFSVGDPETPASSLVVSATSSNPGLLPLSGIVLGGTGGNRSMTLTPAAEQHGSAVVTVTVSDANGASVSTSFDVMVSPVNDSPSLAALENLSLLQSSSAQVVNLSGIASGPANEAYQVVAISAVSSNPTLVPDPVVNYVSPADTGSLTLMPQPGRFGSATITVTINDGQSANGLLSRTFTLNVNGAPTMSAIMDQNVNANGVIGPIPFTVGDPETGASNLTIGLENSSNPTLIPSSGITFGGTGSNRTVTLRPATNLSGFSLVTLSVSDGSGNKSQRSFGVVVNPVDKTPTLDLIGNITILEDSGNQTVPLSGIGMAEPGATLLVSAISSNPQLIPDPEVSYSSPNPTGSLSLAPIANATGTATVTVVVQTLGGTGSPLSRSFTVTVNPVNDAPTLDSLAALAVPANSGPQTVSLAGIGTGATNEQQVLTITATSDNTALIPNPTVSYTSPAATGSLTFSPAANQSGTATITVTVTDNGSTQAGGQNTVTRTFTVTVNPVPGQMRLRIAKAGEGKVVIAWPTNLAGMVLQSRDGMTAPWSDAMNVPALVGSEFMVTNVAVGNRFYRLGPPGVGSTPGLRIFASGPGLITVAWSTNYAGFQLQSSTSLLSPTWTLQLGAVSIVAAEYRMTLAATGNRFFRLVKGETPGANNPRLRIFAAGPGQVIVAWPTNFFGYNLESATSLLSPDWTRQAGAVSVVGEEYRVTLGAAGNKFFRLVKGTSQGVDNASLRIFRSGSGLLTVAWPKDHSGYILQTSPSLAAPSWTTQSGTAALVGEEYQVSLPATGSKFFRLLKNATPPPGSEAATR